MSIRQRLQGKSTPRQAPVCCTNCGSTHLRVRLVDLVGKRTRLACDDCGHVWDLLAVLRHEGNGKVAPAA